MQRKLLLLLVGSKEDKVSFLDKLGFDIVSRSTDTEVILHIEGVEIQIQKNNHRLDSHLHSANNCNSCLNLLDGYDGVIQLIKTQDPQLLVSSLQIPKELVYMYDQGTDGLKGGDQSPREFLASILFELIKSETYHYQAPASPSLLAGIFSLFGMSRQGSEQQETTRRYTPN